MSDCKNFEDMPERIANDECSEEQKTQFYEHIASCDSCKEELEFTLNIRNTLRTLPEIEVPGDFLASLNKKLDVEDEIRVNRRKNVFVGWRKYSALAACLLLTFLLKVDVWNLPDMSGSDNVTVEVEKTIEISPEVTPENVVVPVVVEEIPVSEEHVIEDISNTEQYVIVSEESKVTEEKKPKEIKKPKKEEKKVKVSKAEKVQNVQTIASEENTAELEQVQENKSSGNKVIVIKASTPHSSVDMPEGDEVIVVEKVTPKRVKFEDYKLVESPELMETLAISEGSEKNLIIATPAAMNAVSNISIDTANVKYDVPEANHGAGSGSFFVSVDDRQVVASILRKYSAGENNQTFMLSSRNYESFVSELQRQGIEYTDYMINTGKSNVAFKLMAT